MNRSPHFSVARAARRDVKVRGCFILALVAWFGPLTGVMVKSDMSLPQWGRFDFPFFLWAGVGLVGLALIVMGLVRIAALARLAHRGIAIDAAVQSVICEKGADVGSVDIAFERGGYLIARTLPTRDFDQIDRARETGTVRLIIDPESPERMYLPGADATNDR